MGDRQLLCWRRRQSVQHFAPQRDLSIESTGDGKDDLLAQVKKHGCFSVCQSWKSLYVEKSAK